MKRKRESENVDEIDNLVDLGTQGRSILECECF